MSSKLIRGITIEIGGDTTKLGKALDSVESQSRSLQSELRGVNSLLKLDPTNTTLLAQKQELLKKAISETKEKLKILKDHQDEVREKWEKYGEVKPKLDSVTDEVENTEKQLKKVKERQNEAFEAFKKGELSEKQYNEITQAVKDCETKLKTLRSEQAELEKQAVSGEQFRDYQREIEATELKLKDLNKELGNFGSVGIQQLDAVSKKLKDTGDKITDAGKKISAVSVVAGAALVGVTKEAIDFESAWAGVTKTVDGTPEQLEEIKQGLLDMSQETASTAEEIAAVAEAAGQLGIKTENVLEFTKTMVMLGDTTNLSADEAASALAKFANITQMSADDYGKLGAVIVDLGNNFATTEADIVAMATRLASTGEITGLSEAQIMALAAALSSAGIEAEAGGTAMAKLLKQLFSTNAEFDTAKSVIDATGVSLRELEIVQSIDNARFKQFAYELGLTTSELSGYMKTVGQMNSYAETAGVSVDEFRKAYGEDAVGALSIFIGGLNDTERNGKSAVEILSEMGMTEVRLSNAVLAMASSGDLMTSAIQTANTAWGENTALTEEAEKRYGTTESKLTQLKNTITELCVSLGEILLPIVQSVTEKVKSLVEWFTNLSPTTQKVILVITAIVAAIGPVLVSLGSLISAIGTIIGIVPSLVTAFTAVKTAFTALGAAFAANPIGFIITAVVALVAAFVLLWNNCEGFRNFFINLWENIKVAFAAVVQWFSETIPKIGEFFKKLWSDIVAIWSKVSSWFNTNVIQPVANVFKSLWSSVTNAARSAWTGIKSAFGSVKSWFSSTFSAAWTAVKNVFSSWGSFFSGLWDKIKNTFSKIGTNISNAISSSIKSGLNGVISSIEGIINSGVNMINGAINLINQIPGVSIGKVGKLSLPRFAQGVVADGPTVGLFGEDGTEAVVPLEKNTEWLDVVARKLYERLPGGVGSDPEVLKRLEAIYNRLARMKVVLDSGEVVGGLIDEIDEALGIKQLLTERGV